MPQFQITGAKRDTGKEVTLTINAKDSDAAIKDAGDMNVMVESCEAVQAVEYARPVAPDEVLPIDISRPMKIIEPEPGSRDRGIFAVDYAFFLKICFTIILLIAGFFCFGNHASQLDHFDIDALLCVLLAVVIWKSN